MGDCLGMAGRGTERVRGRHFERVGGTFGRGYVHSFVWGLLHMYVTIYQIVYFNYVVYCMLIKLGVLGLFFFKSVGDQIPVIFPLKLKALGELLGDGRVGKKE